MEIIFALIVFSPALIVGSFLRIAEVRAGARDSFWKAGV